MDDSQVWPCGCGWYYVSSFRVTPGCEIPALASGTPFQQGQQFSFRVLYWQHSAHQAQELHRMVSGDLKRLPQGRSQLQLVSHTPHIDQRPPKTSCKKLQVIICVLLVELFERFTFFGIVCNMILFCTVKLGYDNYLAATINLCFIGASTLTPVLVGWFAEACLGRTKVLYVCAFLHFFGKTQRIKVWWELAVVKKL